MTKFASCRFYLRFTSIMIVIGMFLLGPHPTAFAHQDSHLYIILDNSSSMEDKLSGELKYKLVRRAMSHALYAYRGKLETGLITFGHNHKNSCRDISLVSQLQPLRPHDLSRLVDRLRPKGKSPISAALSAAATLAKNVPDTQHMLLIADGRDNCAANICATAKIISKRLPKTRIHVIGLGNTKAVKGLACISRATRGVFRTVLNAGQMTSALDKILRGVVTKRGLIAKKPITQTLSMLAWRPPLPRRRPPNKVAKYQQPQISERPETLVEIPIINQPADKQQTQIISRDSAAIATDMPAAILPYPTETGAPKQQINRPSLKIAQASPTRPFAGSNTNIETSLPQTMSRVKLGALITEQGNPIKGGLIWRIYNSTKDKDGRYKLVKTLKSPRFEGSLPLGVYLVNLAWGRSHLTEKMELLSSKPFIHNFILNAGGLRLGAKHIDGSLLPTQQVSYQIFSDERDQFGRRRLIVDHAKAGKTIRLNAGIYHVKSHYGTANGIIESDITVEAGKLTDAVINHRASKVTFKLVIQPGGEALAGTLWNISTPDGKLVKKTGGALPTVILSAGDYTINATYSGRSFARKVTIEPGAPVHVEIVIQ